MQNWLWLICFGLFVLTGCKKNVSTITIEGVVRNAVTNSPISGASVQIRVQELNGGALNSTFNTVSNLTTSANGSYTVRFDAHKATQYQIKVNATNYSKSEILINPDDLKRNASNSYNFKLDPIAYYRVHIKNQAGFNANDRITYQITTDQPECPTCCTKTPLTLQGMNTDTIFGCTTTADQFLVAQWLVTKNGITSSFSDSVRCNLGDTVSLFVGY